MLAERAIPSLSELRQLLRRQAPRSLERVEAPLPTGLEAVDPLIGGGLPRGKLTEVCGPRSAGRTAVAMASLASATARGEVAALVDVESSFDVRRGEAAGVVLSRLLWVRAAGARQGVQAADLVLRAGGFGLVVIDLGEAAPRIGDAGWLRLSRAAEKSRTTLLVVALRSAAGTYSALRLEAGGARRPRFLDPARGRALLGVEGTLTVPRARHLRGVMVAGAGDGTEDRESASSSPPPLIEGAQAPLRFRLR